MGNRYAYPLEELVKQAQQGDDIAFSHLACLFQHRLEKIITYYVRDPEEAHDVFQEVLMSAYKNLKNFRGDSAFYTWLYRISVNAAKKHRVKMNSYLRRMDTGNRDRINSYDWVTQEIPSPELEVSCEELDKKLYSLLQRMPKDLRDAFLLRDRDDLSYASISKKMKCPLGTVRSRISRARNYLLTHLN